MTSAAGTDDRAGCRRYLRARTLAEAGGEPTRRTPPHLPAQGRAGAGLSAAGGGAWRARLGGRLSRSLIGSGMARRRCLGEVPRADIGP